MMHRVALGAYVKVAARFNEVREMDRERGLTTTEIAVLTAVLVTTAVAVGALLLAYARGRVTDLPTDTSPPASIDTGD